MTEESIRQPQDLRIRTKHFAIRIIKLYSAMPKHVVAQTIGKQLLRSGTSVGAHIQEGFRARSKAEYVSKLEGGLQELAETTYWMDLIVEAGVFSLSKLSRLMDEAKELNAVLTTCVKKAKANLTANKPRKI